MAKPILTTALQGAMIGGLIALTVVAIGALPGVGNSQTATPAAHADKYAYFPTQQDRQELSACISTRTPSTQEADCLIPITNRILFETMNDLKTIKEWPAYPSQTISFMRLAGHFCKLPDNPPALLMPNNCLGAEGRKAGEAVTAGLRQVLHAMLAKK